MLEVNSTLTGSSADNISVQRTINFSCTLQPTIIFSCSKLVKRKGSLLKYSLKLKKRRLKSKFITHYPQNKLTCPSGVKTLPMKKNGAARLDPWEIFVLLSPKIPFNFI